MYRFAFAWVSILKSGRSRLSNRHPNASPRPGAREAETAEIRIVHPGFARPAVLFVEGAPAAGICWIGRHMGENQDIGRGNRMYRGSDSERHDRTEMQRQRDRDYAKELCASRLAFTLSRTGTSKEDYCRAVGISSSTLSRILNRQTLMSTSTLIETARYFEDTSVSWFLGL